jgi:regulator of replication initiation timing
VAVKLFEENRQLKTQNEELKTQLDEMNLRNSWLLNSRWRKLGLRLGIVKKFPFE